MSSIAPGSPIWCAGPPGAGPGVVLADNTGGELPPNFIEAFADALSEHRSRERDTTAVPA